MLTRDEKRRAFLIVMNGFMEKYAAEIEGAGMSDERLVSCIARRMKFIGGKIANVVDRVNACAMEGSFWRGRMDFSRQHGPGNAFVQVELVEWIVGFYAVRT
jgi:hypothetical protein